MDFDDILLVKMIIPSISISHKKSIKLLDLPFGRFIAGKVTHGGCSNFSSKRCLVGNCKIDKPMDLGGFKGFPPLFWLPKPQDLGNDGND
jgi:hypothetical protein